MRSRKEQAAIGVFLGDGDDEAQVGLDHLLLSLPRLAFALLHGVDDAAIVVDRHARFGGQRRHVLPDVGDLMSVFLDELGPAHAGALHPVGPVGRELSPEVGLQELGTRDAVAVGQTQQPTLQPHQALVDRVQLLDQRLDPVVVELEALQVADDAARELQVASAVLLREVAAGEPGLDQLLLQAAEGVELRGDRVQRLHDAVAQLGLHGADRRAGAVVELVVFRSFRSRGGGTVVILSSRCGLRCSNDGLRHSIVDRLRTVQTTVSLFEVDDFAQQDAAVLQARRATP